MKIAARPKKTQPRKLKPQKFESKKMPPQKVPPKKELVKKEGSGGKPIVPVPESVAKPVQEEVFINPNIVTANLNVLETYLKGKKTIGVIKVEAEETLGHYADWLQIPTQEIRRLNRFKYGKPISIDQKIKLPMRKKTVQEFEEQRYEFHKELEEDFFESFSIQEIEVYTVKKGDNIWTLSLNELEVPLWLIKKYNPGMRFDTLLPLQQIKYPIINSLKED